MKKKHEKAVATIIGDFLLANGAADLTGNFGNCFECWVEGTVEKSEHGQLDWMTSEAHKLTIKEHRDLGSQLNEQLRKYMEKHDIAGILFIEPLHIQHGCYDVQFYLKQVRIVRQLVKTRPVQRVEQY